CAIYAFMRHSDDVSDDGPVEERPERMRLWRQEVDAALDGKGGQNPLLPALCHTVSAYRLPHQLLHDVIDGTSMDLVTRRYETFEELRRYCYHVAGAVGLICLRVWGCEGIEDAAVAPAEACGLAFQLTNILRDIREDAARDRIYLPAEDMARFQVTEQSILLGRLSPQVKELIAFQCRRAAEYYKEALALLPLLPASSRPTLQIMMDIYRSILEDIVRNDYDVFSTRAGISSGRKLRIVARAWVAGKRTMRRAYAGG
ncbi:MAG TPA: phytoene/squalene synthase family protein, partial [Chthonomonadales bacterium]|nr:phytoene/squalene synthase family protein [Chthonomonadales bacterium]